MEPEKEKRQRIAKQWLSHYEQEYIKTKNPLNVWRAYGVCRGDDLEIPSWVFSYLDSIARAFWDASMAENKTPNDVEEFVFDTLQFKGFGAKTGTENIFSKYKDTESLIIATEISCLVGQGHKEKTAWELTAKKRNISASKSYRCWKEHKHLFNELVSQERRFHETKD